MDLLDSQKIAYYSKRVEVLMGELDHLTGARPQLTQEERLKELGHPKELFEKLYSACEAVKQTHEGLPKVVERME